MKHVAPAGQKMAPETHVTTYRVAVSGDEAGILEVFAEVASEVPTAVQPQTEAYIKRFVASGQSWVATDADGKIIGYALAEKAADTISLVYLGVAKKARGQHISTALVSKLKESGVPIVTDVQSDNKSSMVERFGRFRFVKTPTVFTGSLREKRSCAGRSRLRLQADRNNPTSANQTRLQASLIEPKHCAIRPQLPAGLGFRQGQASY